MRNKTNVNIYSLTFFHKNNLQENIIQHNKFQIILSGNNLEMKILIIVLIFQY